MKKANRSRSRSRSRPRPKSGVGNNADGGAAPSSSGAGLRDGGGSSPPRWPSASSDDGGDGDGDGDGGGGARCGRGKENLGTGSDPSSREGGKDVSSSCGSGPKSTVRSRGIAPSSFHRRLIAGTGPGETAESSGRGRSRGRNPAGSVRPPRPSNGDGGRASDGDGGGAAPPSQRQQQQPPSTSLDRLRQILSEAQIRLVQNKRRDITTQLKVRRAAFRDCTVLRSWPLQELALDDLDALMGEHLGRRTEELRGGGDGVVDDGGDADACGSAQDQRQQQQQQLHQLSGFESDSTGVSTSSIDEPKRPRGGGDGRKKKTLGKDAGGRPSMLQDLSPGKSTLRARYAAEFRAEREIVPRQPAGGAAVAEAKAEAETEGEAEAEAKVKTEVALVNAHNDEEPPGTESESTDSDDANRDGANNSSDNGGGTAGAGTTPPPFLPALWCLEPRIFALEKSAAGKRRYLTGHLGRFLDLYWRKVDPNRRHYYELIREGTPCRLYFDLEFHRESNSGIGSDDGDRMVDELIEEAASEFTTRYGIVGVDRRCVVDLDSSTDQKFSRHLIFHLPGGELFPDAAACGAFVRDLVGRLAGEAASGELVKRGRGTLARHLFVRVKGAGGKSAGEAKIKSEGGGEEAGGGSDDRAGTTAGPSSSPTDDAPSSSSPAGQQHRDDGGGATACFVDLGVYTRNRLFRLLGSAKYGKPPSAALRIARSNRFPFPPGFGNDRFYVPDQERGGSGIEEAADEEDDAEAGAGPGSKPSRISGEGVGSNAGVAVGGTDGEDRGSGACGGDASPADCHRDSLDCDDAEIAAFLSSMDWSAHAEALASTLVVPINYSKMNFHILPDPVEASDLSQMPPGGAKGQNNPGTHHGRSTRTVSKLSYGPSPLPCLDDFVGNVLASRGGATGSIRTWTMDMLGPSKPCRITYHMQGNRWCERIGRQHKSNNVIWTVDLQGMFCYQACFDPDCRGFRGEPIDVPLDIQEQARDILFEYELAAFDEHEAIEKVRCKERSQSWEQSLAKEEEFEKALLALDIAGGNTAEGVVESSDVRAPGGSNLERINNGPSDLNSSLEEEWSDALSQAVLTNPELFP